MPIKPNPRVRHMQDSDISTLQNICRVAAERFRDNASLFDKLALETTPPEGSLHPTGEAAKRLAVQFHMQADEASAFADLFADANPFSIELALEEEEA
jgi:hypothetical protein